MHDLLKMKMDFEREERNMLILRHPYLTVEQSVGHGKAVRDRVKEFKEQKQEEIRQKFIRQVTFADRLCHLGYGETWD